MAEFTQGPWTTGALMTRVEVWPEGWNAPMCVADCNARHSPSSQVERVANASLIAASPALYEACKRGLHWADCHDMKTADSQVREDIAFIRAALALAEGRGEE